MRSNVLSKSCLSELNHDAQYCALPGDFAVKENSFYVETMPGKDDVVSIFTLVFGS